MLIQQEQFGDGLFKNFFPKLKGWKKFKPNNTQPLKQYPFDSSQNAMNTFHTQQPLKQKSQNKSKFLGVPPFHTTQTQNQNTNLIDLHHELKPIKDKKTESPNLIELYDNSANPQKRKPRKHINAQTDNQALWIKKPEPQSQTENQASLNAWIKKPEPQSQTENQALWIKKPEPQSQFTNIWTIIQKKANIDKQDFINMMTQNPDSFIHYLQDNDETYRDIHLLKCINYVLYNQASNLRNILPIDKHAYAQLLNFLKSGPPIQIGHKFVQFFAEYFKNNDNIHPFFAPYIFSVIRIKNHNTYKITTLFDIQHMKPQKDLILYDFKDNQHLYAIHTP